jgi:hypothetical protein
MTAPFPTHPLRYQVEPHLLLQRWEGEEEAVAYAPLTAQTHLLDEAAAAVLLAALNRGVAGFSSPQLAQDLGLNPETDALALANLDTLLQKLCAMALLIRPDRP